MAWKYEGRQHTYFHLSLTDFKRFEVLLIKLLFIWQVIKLRELTSTTGVSGWINAEVYCTGLCSRDILRVNGFLVENWHIDNLSSKTAIRLLMVTKYKRKGNSNGGSWNKEQLLAALDAINF